MSILSLNQLPLTTARVRIFSVISVFDALCKRDKPTVLTRKLEKEREQWQRDPRDTG